VSSVIEDFTHMTVIVPVGILEEIVFVEVVVTVVVLLVSVIVFVVVDMDVVEVVLVVVEVVLVVVVKQMGGVAITLNVTQYCGD
jgi:hypothetical protein